MENPPTSPGLSDRPWSGPHTPKSHSDRPGQNPFSCTRLTFSTDAPTKASPDRTRPNSAARAVCLLACTPAFSPAGPGLDADRLPHGRRQL